MRSVSLSTLTAALLSSGLVTSVLAQETGVLDTVVVTAAGHEQSVKDAPASISVVTREDLEKQAYTDVIDAVKNLPGVFVTNGGNMQDISIRGMSAGYTLYLVDGRPVSAGRSVNTNGADGGKQIGLPPLSMIERIEVIRGPASTLYGADAMGGVVNIITRKATGEWVGSFGTEYTKSLNDISEDGYGVDASVSGPLIPGLLGLKANVALSGLEESHHVGGDDGAASQPHAKRRNGGAELVLTPDAQNTFTMGFRSSRQDTTHTPGRSIAASAAAPSEYRYDKDVFTLTHAGRYNGLVMDSYLQHDVSDKVQELTKKESITILNSQGTYAWGNHLITFGGQLRNEEVINETNGLITALPGFGQAKLKRWMASAFGEMDWAVSEKLSVVTGLRYDHDENYGGQLSPRVYGTYRHTPQWTFKGGLSTGYKQPTLAQSSATYGGTTGGGGWQGYAPHSRAISVGNPDLKPETSTNFELGAAFESADKKLASSLTVFHTDFKDKIAEDRYCTSPNASSNNDYANWACPYGANRYYFLSTSMNIDKAVMQGLEATLNYRFTPALRLSSSYTFTHSEQKSGQFAGNPLTKQPRHMLNALVDWKASSQIDVWVQGNFRSSTSDYLNRTTMAKGTPSYGFIDVGMVYKFNPKTRLKVGLYNLGNKEVTNENYGVVLDGRRVTVGLNMDF